MGPFKKLCHFIMTFFTPFTFVTLCQFHPNTWPLLFTKLHKETVEREKRRFFACMAASAYHVISKEVKNRILIHNWIFRHSCCINNPHWQISGIIIFLRKCYIVTSDTLACSFLDPNFYVTFCCALHLLPPCPKWRTCWMVPITTHNIAICCILCNEIMSGRLKFWKSLAIKY